jgi:peptidoglycan hydrolase-like protein with peptidoglycan-binding domain
MKRLLNAALACALLLCVAAAAYAQNSNTNAPAGGGNTNASATKKRGPVFRATKDQIKQAQDILRQRGFYAGESAGKLDPTTREGLRKYQGAEGLKVTGTLNAATLQKMNVTLSDKQKAWVAAQAAGGR